MLPVSSCKPWIHAQCYSVGGRRYTAEEKWRLVALYDSGHSIDHCAKDAGVTFATMRQNLQRWGAKMRRRGPPRKHQLNERYFQNIYNQERAYWLGFVQGHGHLGTTGAGNRYLKVELGLQDAYHLSAMAAALGYTGQAQYAFDKGRHGSAYLKFHSSLLVKDVVEHQTLDDLPPELLHHALRGHFDAGGRIYDTGAGWVLSIEGPEYVLEAFASHDKAVRFRDETKIQWDSIDVVERVLLWLYTDAQIYLLRKKLEADVIMGV